MRAAVQPGVDLAGRGRLLLAARTFFDELDASGTSPIAPVSFEPRYQCLVRQVSGGETQRFERLRDAFRRAECAERYATSAAEEATTAAPQRVA